MKDLTAEQIADILKVPLVNVVSNWPTIQGNLVCHGMNSWYIDIAALATIRVETLIFKPISEEYDGDPEVYFAKYDHRDGNYLPGDGYKFRGRGYIQLTGRANYTSYGKEVGLNLIDNPDLALNPVVAAKIFALFFKNRGIDVQAIMENWRKVRLLVDGGLNQYPLFLGYVNRLLEASNS